MDNRDLELLQAIQLIIDPLKNDMQDMKNDMQDVKSRLTNVENEVHNTNITIETEIRKNIQILVEGNQAIRDKLWHLPEKVENIEESVSILKFIQTAMANDVWKK